MEQVPRRERRPNTLPKEQACPKDDAYDEESGDSMDGLTADEDVEKVVASLIQPQRIGQQKYNLT